MPQTHPGAATACHDVLIVGGGLVGASLAIALALLTLNFDGATIPEAISDVRGVQNLLSAMLEHGYGQELVEKIALRNWVEVLGRTLK